MCPKGPWKRRGRGGKSGGLRAYHLFSTPRSGQKAVPYNYAEDSEGVLINRERLTACSNI